MLCFLHHPSARCSFRSLISDLSVCVCSCSDACSENLACLEIASAILGRQPSVVTEFSMLGSLMKLFDCKFSFWQYLRYTFRYLVRKMFSWLVKKIWPSTKKSNFLSSRYHATQHVQEQLEKGAQWQLEQCSHAHCHHTTGWHIWSVCSWAVGSYSSGLPAADQMCHPV